MHSQPPPTPTLLSLTCCQVSQMQTTPRLETPSPSPIPPPPRLLVLKGKGSCNNLALELQREHEGMRRSGPPEPHRFQGGKCAIKMHFCWGSVAASQQSHHCLRLHCCCPQPSKRQPNRLSSWNRNAGSGPTDAPETPLCLPTLPLFKNKTKSPTPPSALQHPRHQGRTDGGGRTLHMPAREADLPEYSQ